MARSLSSDFDTVSLSVKIISEQSKQIVNFMIEIIKETLNNSIITHAYIIVAVLIISIPLSFLQSKKQSASVPILWLILNRVFLSTLIKLNAPNRSAQDLFLRGLVVICIFIGLATAFIVAINLTLSSALHRQFFEIVFLSICVVTLQPFLLSGAIHKDLANTKQKTLSVPLQNALSLSTMRAVSTADESGYNRLLINLATTNYARDFLLPIFLYLIGGLPILLVATLFTWLSYAVGKNTLTGPYTYTLILFEALLRTVPNFIAATLLVMASAIVPKAKSIKALHSISQTKSIQPLSILANSLNISIGGKQKSRFGDLIEAPWYGPKSAKAKIERSALRLALYLISVAQLLSIFALALLL
jgi:cobalamin biosynthesis protein CobD/CbiB